MALFTDLKVYPVSWEKKLKANLKKDWEIRYSYFYLNTWHIIRFKGMNREKTLEDKQRVTRELMDLEVENLKKGFNPITKEYESEINEINETTPFLKALKIASDNVMVSEATTKQIKWHIDLITPLATKRGLSGKEISKVRRRDVKLLLDEMVKNGASNDRYNKIRAYLSICFKYFTQLEIFEFNYIRDIEKLQHTPAKKEIFREAEKKKLLELKELHYPLWRFLNILYFSGARIIELRNLLTEKVNLDENYFEVFVKKGKQYQWVKKPINHQIKNLWEELMEKSKGKKYIFGNALAPDDNPCTHDSFYLKYKRNVNKKLKIKRSPYALKHTFLNDITKAYGIEEARKLAGHSSEKTTMIYAVDYADMVLEQQTKANVSLLVE